MFYPDNAAGQLRCIDLASGTTRWTAGNFGRSGLLLVGTNLLCLTERGSLILVAAQTNAYQELGRFLAIPDYHSDTNKCWNTFAVSDGQVYVRSTAYAARFDLSLPDLILDAPLLSSGNQLQLTVRTVTGAALDANRMNLLEVRAATNAALPPSQWTKLTNALVLSNGIARMRNVDASPPRRFFITTEPP